jgi:N utilization substance protein B
MSRKRSRAREVALQLLVQADLNPSVDRPHVERFVHDRLGDDDLETFALSLYDGVQAHRAAIDQALAQAARNWRVERMAVPDRNALRLGTFELLHRPDTPAGAVINEAIELARRFASADSPAFVNGVLDRVHKTAQATGPAGDGERQDETPHRHQTVQTAAPPPPPAPSPNGGDGGT